MTPWTRAKKTLWGKESCPDTPWPAAGTGSREKGGNVREYAEIFKKYVAIWVSFMTFFQYCNAGSGRRSVLSSQRAGRRGGWGGGGQRGGTELEAGCSRVASGRGLGLGGVGAPPGATKLPPCLQETLQNQSQPGFPWDAVGGAVGIFDSFSRFFFSFCLKVSFLSMGGIGGHSVTAASVPWGSWAPFAAATPRRSPSCSPPSFKHLIRFAGFVRSEELFCFVIVSLLLFVVGRGAPFLPSPPNLPPVWL